MQHLASVQYAVAVRWVGARGCVCVRERERERQTEKERERERERVYVHTRW